MKSEVVIISEVEANYFGANVGVEKEPEAPMPISAPKDQGLYLAFLPINDQSLSLYLINDSISPTWSILRRSSGRIIEHSLQAL
ncbi:hypothetical protein [Algoriphagus boritolerans]|uniref:hypothetical protein n=1 Tax=Algoriphagus boritolerans TaxID=308111 RepID=UPI002FCE0191